MLHKPNLPDQALVDALREEYVLGVVEIEFLPLGADWNTAVYRVVADDGRAYFLKLRSGVFDDTGVVVSRLLYDNGITEVIPPIQTRGRGLWTHVERFALVLCPFVDGENGYAREPSELQWRQLGTVLRRLHATQLPTALGARVPRDTFAPAWIDMLRRYVERAGGEVLGDPVDSIAGELLGVLRLRGESIRKLIQRTEQLADALTSAKPPVALGHGDWHPGNVLITPGGALHVVDWDTLVFAPRERDFSLIGLTWGGERETELFYEGYGDVKLDPVALAYYRYHRIVEDIAVDCAALLDSSEGGASRAKMFAAVERWLQPGGRIDEARRHEQLR